MKIINKLKKYSNFIIICILLIIVGYLYFDRKQIASVNSNNISSYESKLNTYKDKLDRLVSEKKSIQLSKNELSILNDSLKLAIKNIKPESITKTKIKVIYKDTTIINFDKTIDTQFKQLFYKHDKYMTISGSVSNFGICFTKIEFNLELTNTIGFTRKNIFYKYQPISRIVNNNPYVKIIDINTYTIKPKESIFANKWLWAGLGFMSGLIIMK